MHQTFPFYESGLVGIWLPANINPPQEYINSWIHTHQSVYIKYI